MLIILLLILFLRPFLCSSAFPFPDLIYSAILFIYLIFWLSQKVRQFWILNTITCSILLFVAALILSLLSNPHDPLPIRNISQYTLGILLFLTGYTLSLKEKERLIRNILLAGITISLTTFYQYFFTFPDLIREAPLKGKSSLFIEHLKLKRVFFPMLTPNALGGYLAMLIPSALSLPHGIWPALLLFLALFITKSIWASLSLALALPLYFTLQKRFKFPEITLFLTVIVIATLIYIIRMNIGSPAHHPHYSLTMRFTYWAETITIINAHPWTGIGPGNFNLTGARDSHNLFLQMWAELGLPGLLSFLFIITSVFRSGLTALKNPHSKILSIGLLCSCSVFLIHNMFDFTFYLPEICLIWWLIMGLTANSAHPTPAQTAPPD